MFPFKKPPTKLEVARQTVADAAHHLLDAVPTEKIEERLGDLKKGAALAAQQAAQAAHHAGDLAAHKLEELQHLGAHLGEGASKTAQSAAQTAQNAQSAGQVAAAAALAKAGAAAQNARESAQAARENLGGKAETLRDSASGTVSSFRDTLKERTSRDLKIGEQEAQNAKEMAQKVAEREAQAARARAEAVKARAQAKEAEIAAKSARKIADQADKVAEGEAEAARNQVIDAKNAAKAEARAVIEREKAAAAAEREKVAAKREKQEFKEREIRAVNAPARFEGAESSEIEIADSGSKWGWILLGLALGAIAALLLAPTSGRRSRAAIKDRLGKVSDGAVDAATTTADKVVDIAQRVEGLANKAETKLSADGETDDDGTIADRVRSVLGHHEVAKTLDRLNIDCADGVITLRGPLLDGETEQILIAAVSTVPGVKSVVSDFLVDEEPASPADSVG